MPGILLAVPVVLAGVAQALAQPSVGPAPAVAPLQLPKVGDMSNADLISFLPPARQEHEYSAKAGAWMNDPYSPEFAQRIEAGKVTDDELGAAVRRCGLLRAA